MNSFSGPPRRDLMDKPFVISEDGYSGSVYANKEFFTRECVLYTANMYESSFFLSIFPFDEFTVQINIKSKKDSLITEETLRNFMNNLIDVQTKIDLQKEFHNIRAKIVEYAFSPIR